MVFSSIEFIVFALVFFAFWPFILKLKNIKFLYIITFSCIFYGWWDWRFLFLILFTGTVDYFAALAIERWNKHKTKFLILSLVADLGTLSIFKYTSFFIETVNDLLHVCGSSFVWAPEIPEFVLILPVGISFYTFQSMSYTIDVYKGELKPTKNILHFFTYLSMFPQLVAGPIVRAKDILSQLLEARVLTHDCYETAYKLIAYGYLKKCFVADNLAPFVNEAFQNPIPVESTIYWWIVMISFAIQIYCDFSGYSDIAIGLGRLMGFRFKRNFNHPYLATSLSEFWSRWHISLSTWFRDYVYIPLGGNRCSPVRVHFNLWITMILSGLWHGAALHFVAWGAFHAFFLSLEKTCKKYCKFQIPKVCSWALTLLLVVTAWGFFRAQNFEQAIAVLKQMYCVNLILERPSGLALLVANCFVARYLYILFFQNKFHKFTFYKVYEEVIVAMSLVIAIYFRGIGNQFIYFQF